MVHSHSAWFFDFTNAGAALLPSGVGCVS